MAEARLKIAGMEAAPIEFIDLQAQRRRIGARMDKAIADVLAHGQYILGPEVAKLEQQLAAHSGVRNAIGCSNGTDAIVLALRALGVGPGDGVICPSFTFAATGEAIALVGASPIFVDVDAHTCNMCPASLEAAIEAVEAEGRLRLVGIIPVDLYGQAAEYRRINAIAEAHGLFVIADAAQSYGATLDNRRVGTLARITTTSFFPAKPLGCYGDGGAIFTDDDELSAVIRSLLFHGRSVHDKYDNIRIGMNARLDTLQAAILIEKLALFDEEKIARQAAADYYTAALKDVVGTPTMVPGATSVWAQYTMRVENRDRVAATLKAEGIPTNIYYPRPLHTQTVYNAYPVAPGGLPVTEQLARTVLSIPMHAYLDRGTQDRVIDGVRRAVKT
jgi:dTDP-4-amino-4,6-dideoxygalactose transaminase